MNNEIFELINDFNQTLLTLAMNIAESCPNSLVGQNFKDIKKNINDKNNLTKFIDLFTTKVLQYKTQIDSGDESFFMEKDYKSDLKECNDSYLSNVISVKSIWKDLSEDNKHIVITYFQILCALSQGYFDSFQD